MKRLRKYLGPVADRSVESIKNCNSYVYFNKMCISCCKRYIVCSNIKFITNITNITGIHTSYFYNNKHIFIITDITFTIKHTYFIKINTDPVARP